jgi:hypothetical protein
MKVKIEHSDFAEIFHSNNLHVGAYIAAVNAAKKVLHLPWCAPGEYVEKILNAISDFHKQESEKTNSLLV